IGGFSDLIQYVSVTAEDEALAAIGKKFVSYLVTKGQNGVNTLGLIAVASEANIGDNGLIDCFFDVECAYTLSPFTSKNLVENALDKYNASPKSEQDRAQFIKSVTKRLK
ncbi:MAG: hypothetical protein ILP02_04080, partial [Clostridia bacterium]|nr:hypothetical protein [Clostridia bacterium]